MKRGSLFGFLRGKYHNLDMISSWDNEEDLTVPAGDTVLSSGNTPDSVARNKFYCRAIHNYGETAITVVYYLIGMAETTDRTCRIPSGQTFHVLNNILTIRGTGNGTTAAATIKLLYKERRIVDNDAPEKAAI